MASKEKMVMAFGTFDIFHKGHESYLEQAKKFGNELIVVIARDQNVSRIKGKKPENNELTRLVAVKNFPLADLAVLGSLGDKYYIIKKYKPDVICLGYDQGADLDEMRSKLTEFKLKSTKIVRLRPYYPKKYKSSLLYK